MSLGYDTSVTPGHTPGRHRPLGAIHRGTGISHPVPPASEEGISLPAYAELVERHGPSSDAPSH